MSVIDARLQIGNQFGQRSAESVIHRLAEDVRPRSHEVRSNAECGTCFEMMFQPHVGFVDLEIVPQRFHALFNKFGESCGWLVIAVCKNEFHNSRRIIADSGFDKYTNWKLP